MFKDEARFRRHKGACPYYRENWATGDQQTSQGETLLYEIYCLKGWPPESREEQDSCMCATRRCWRNKEDHRITPEESYRLREAQTA